MGRGQRLGASLLPKELGLPGQHGLGRDTEQLPLDGLLVDSMVLGLSHSGRTSWSEMLGGDGVGSGGMGGGGDWGFLSASFPQLRGLSGRGPLMTGLGWPSSSTHPPWLV